MKIADVHVGGRYVAKVSGSLTTVRVLAVRQVPPAWHEAGERGATLESIRASTGMAHSRIATALAFLRERGIIEKGRKRRCFAASGSVHLDAMTEYHALREGDRD